MACGGSIPNRVKTCGLTNQLPGINDHEAKNVVAITNAPTKEKTKSFNGLGDRSYISPGILYITIMIILLCCAVRVPPMGLRLAAIMTDQCYDAIDRAL